jgi:hypothetical protein
MARTTFFSFHYDRDIWRASQVRKSDVVQSDDIQQEGFIDGATWESLKKSGDDEIKKWINSELSGTSVTTVLIGSKTHTRDWVEYETEQSIGDVKGLLGIYIHNIKDSDGNTDIKGSNPLDDHKIPMEDGSSLTASNYYNTYDWVLDNGRDNLGEWIEEAADLAGR